MCFLVGRQYHRYSTMLATKRSIALGVRAPFNGVFEAMDHNPPNAIFTVADVLAVLYRGNAWSALPIR